MTDATRNLRRRPRALVRLDHGGERRRHRRRAPVQFDGSRLPALGGGDGRRPPGRWRALRLLLLIVLGAGLVRAVHSTLPDGLTATNLDTLLTAGGIGGAPAGPRLDSDAERTATMSRVVREAAEAALGRNPLDAQALRVLGQLANAAGDETRAATLMTAAVQRSLQETQALHWLLGYAYRRADYPAVAYFADALLRTRPQLIGEVAPLLARLVENKAARGEVGKLLANNPPWRGDFLRALPHTVADPRTPLLVLLDLSKTPSPATQLERRSYIGTLLSQGFYEVAYYTWLQFLPADQLGAAGPLFNGGFSGKPSGMPFDWVITPGAGVTIDIAPRPDDKEDRALFVAFGYGRVDFQGVHQMLLLTPGAYRLTGTYRGEIIGRRGLVWRVACESGAPLGQSTMMAGPAPAWSAFDFAFAVPDRGCRAQRLTLAHDARSPSEQLASGNFWYDDLRIYRDDSADRAPDDAARDPLSALSLR